VAETESKKTSEEPKFPRERIVREATELLGEPRRHVVAGALSDLKGSGDITLASARRAVDNYRNREVKKEAGE
jgi:hypothetical protein